MSIFGKKTLAAPSHEFCDCECMHIQKRLGEDCKKCNCIMCHTCKMFIKKIFLEQHRRHCSSVLGTPKF